MRVRRPGTAGTVVALLVALASASPPGVRAGDVAAPVDPSVVQPVPLPGEVVPAGQVTVGARLQAGAGIDGVELRVDGSPVAHALHATGTTHREVRATVPLGHGHHRVEVRFVDGRGRSAGRAWWIGVSDLHLRRVAGPDRFATAVAVSQRHHPRDRTAASAVLARGDAFADALGGATLAAQVGGPLLLAASDDLPAVTAAELRRVVVPGGTVHLLGGGSALSRRVEDQVRALGFVPQRHAGPDRYATGIAVAELVPETTTAVVASAWSFPDALGASAPAARDGLPILLTAPDRLPTPVRDLLAERRFDQVHVVGGPAVVGDHVLREIDAVAGSVRRIAGATRYDTAAAVADAFYGAAPTVVVASGEGFADALSGGPYAGALGAPLVLSPPGQLARPQERRMADGAVDRALLLGGPAALTPGLEAHLRRADVGSADGPWERAVHPPPGATLSELPDVTVGFDRPLERSDRSSLHLTLDGVEVPATVEHGGDRLVLRPLGSPFPLEGGRTYALRVAVAGYGGGAWRHLDQTLWLRTGPTRSPPGVVVSLPDDGASGVAPGDRAVALTFDDGPSPAYTPQILDVLERYGATATFFVTGSNVDRFPLLVRDTAARGHVVSNHTMTHPKLTGLSAAAFGYEVDATTRRIVDVTGQAVSCVRPPYGAYDATVVSRLAGRGLHTAMWSIDPSDWARPGADTIVRRTLSELHPGAVVVLHDGGGDRSQTVAALPRLIEGIRAAGYRIAVLCR